VGSAWGRTRAWRGIGDRDGIIRRMPLDRCLPLLRLGADKPRLIL
jgi:hypothetical protein